MAGLVAPATARAQSAADTASVQAFYQRWFGSLAQGPDRYAGFYAEDGTVLPPNMAPAQGRAAIAEWLRASQAAATHATRPTGLVVDEMRFLSASLVLHRTTLSGERVPKAGGPAVPFRTRYVDLLRRTADGWEVLYRIWNDVPPSH
ncbi:MAG: DUF4440 domain-containing protein [Gemmatimonadaceae bacterium]|nr:DUF4440 domain-containing protein [Gemmatimonadaceae bacterium]